MLNKNYLISCVTVLSLLVGSAHAMEDEVDTVVKVPLNANREEDSLIANGQGISSPSFWNGLDGENPAGLVLNQTVKVKISAGSYVGKIGASVGTPIANYSYGAGSLLIGNGLLGAGLEIQNYGNYFGTNTVGKINWGIAGRIERLMSSFGLSSHTILSGAETTFDLGMLFEPTEKLRIGFMLPNFTHHIQIFTGGLTYHFNSSLDLVVDADYNSSLSLGVLKPGVSYGFNQFEVKAAYGLRYLGITDMILTHGFTGGLGLKIFEPLLFSYEYCGGPDHRLGLTLRFN